uniref:Endoplasmic reticulum-Golgi intermediate compartment protein 1 n=1 Tax=Plectus sambesii TaxID=2011161 RepID=A0A914X8Y3_9BILA
MGFDVKRFDIYRKVPKDLTQPTLTGACVSIGCVVFIVFMFTSELIHFLQVDIHSELFVDDPGREGRVNVSISVSLPHMACEYIGIDIQDEKGRHEVGYVSNTDKVPLTDTNGCRFSSQFEINKVPGNFHISTHSAAAQPPNPDMRHIIHHIKFGHDIAHRSLLGSFNPLGGRDASQTDPLNTHEYILKIVPSVYEELNANLLHSYQYTYAVKDHMAYHQSGRIIPAIWFRYEISPITVKYTERRQPFYSFLTTVCAIVGGTFTVAGILDSMIFTASEYYKKFEMGKLN